MNSSPTSQLKSSDTRSIRQRPAKLRPQKEVRHRTQLGPDCEQNHAQHESYLHHRLAPFVISLKRSAYKDKRNNSSFEKALSQIKKHTARPPR
ncbi:hypothetical protein EBS43_00125 [bacterium]|nr:hypothetical protein [bacterium]